jgi:hypothetical protein
VIAARGPQGLYLGYVPTLWRDVPGYALFFGSYELLKREFAKIPIFRKAHVPEPENEHKHGHGGGHGGHGGDDLNPVAFILAGMSLSFSIANC